MVYRGGLHRRDLTTSLEHVELGTNMNSSPSSSEHGSYDECLINDMDHIKQHRGLVAQASPRNASASKRFLHKRLLTIAVVVLVIIVGCNYIVYGSWIAYTVPEETSVVVVDPSGSISEKEMAAVERDFNLSALKEGCGEGFTLVSQIYGRPWLAADFVARYASTPCLRKVILVWNAIGTSEPSIDDLRSKIKPQSEDDHTAKTLAVEIWSNGKNSMNNRFLIPDSIVPTEAIILLDDDLVVEHADLHYLYTQWRHSREQLIGFLPRRVVGPDENGKYRYDFRVGNGAGSPSATESNAADMYNMILVGASCYSKRYNKAYASENFKKDREYVDKVTNCDDMLMNIVVQSIGKMPPVQVRRPVISVQDFKAEATGLSQAEDWADQRDACANTLMGNHPDFQFLWMDHALQSPHSDMSSRWEDLKDPNAEKSSDDDATQLALISSSMAMAARLKVSVVMISYNRVHNLPTILCDLQNRYNPLIKDVTIWNNNVENPIDMSRDLIRPAECQLMLDLRVINAEKNIFTEAKFHACAQAKTNVCYIQDDDFRPVFLQSLLAESYRLSENRDIILDATDRNTYNLNHKWTFFDDTIGMHSGCAWNGVGSIIRKDMARKFIRQLDELHFDKDMRLYADICFPILQNEIPITLVGPLVEEGLDTGSAYNCSDCIEHRDMNLQVRAYCARKLHEVLSQKEAMTSLVSRRFASAEFRKRTSKALCDESKTPACLFHTNVDILPQLVSEIAYNDTNLETQVQGGSIFPEYKENLLFHHAIDSDTNTSWAPYKKFEKGDHIALDLAHPVDIVGISIAFDQALTPEERLAIAKGIRLSRNGSDFRDLPHTVTVLGDYYNHFAEKLEGPNSAVTLSFDKETQTRFIRLVFPVEYEGGIVEFNAVYQHLD
eukprot:Clim_evm3s1 gene=Clim_evmTU3s1